jgi:hypothetical protein
MYNIVDVTSSGTSDSNSQLCTKWSVSGLSECQRLPYDTFDLDQLTNKLSSACYTIRVMKPLKTLIMIYYAYFHSLMNYSIIFWGNCSYSIHIFRLQKKVIRIITSARNRESCRSWFKRLKILPLQLQYIYSILSFVIDNMN